MLKAALALGVARPTRAGAQETGDPAQAPPRTGDGFAFAFGSRAGERVGPGDLAVDGPQVFAYPLDPATGVVRNGSRLNQVILVRLAAGTLADGTRGRAAEGIVAYSAVCTHTGCDVEGWDASTGRFHCPCHDSEFSAGDGGQVESGPARLPLAALPVRIVDGELTVAGPFEGRLGAAEL